jgi:hypothetical protein
MAVEVKYVEEAEMFFQAWKQGLVSEQFITTLCEELDDLSQDESFGSYRQAASNMCKHLTSRVGADHVAPGRSTSRGLSDRGSRSHQWTNGASPNRRSRRALTP